MALSPGARLALLSPSVRIREDRAMETAGSPRTAPEAPILQIRLLGGFSLWQGDRLITALDAPRLHSVLAYLLLHAGAPQARDQIAFRFWPDSGESQARTNLRQALHLLRRALPDADRFLDTDGRSVRWRAESPFSLDVVEFDRLLARGDEARETRGERAALEAAAALYAGDLLSGCDDDWLATERGRLRDGFRRAVERLADLSEAERDYRGAIRWGRRLVELDPVDEAASARLMRLHALSGDRAGALRVYHGCATALVRELGVAPTAATREAYERLLEGEAAPAPSELGRGEAPFPLVGRREEWDALRGAWRRSVEGRSQLVLIAGEAGIGKSRLADELRDWVARQGFASAVSRCYAAAGALAYAPVVDLLRSRAIGPVLRRLGDPWLAELARLLPELREERPQLPLPPPLTDDWQRARLLDAVSRAVLAEGRPLLLMIDDLQWCDGETLAWLHYLLRARPEAPALVVATARSEELGPQHPAESLLLAARAGGQSLELELRPLGAAEAATLASHVLGRRLDDERELVLHRETEDNPLFVVEWVRAGLVRDDQRGPAGTAPDGGWRLPPRAHSVIDARLAQLSPAGQELASLAATVGRAFTFDVVARASPRGEEQMIEAIDELWRRRIVREGGVDAYDFSHDKLREAAYRLPGPARRRMMHRRVAQALEEIHGADLDAVSGQLAAHYERGGLPERAIEGYERAAAVTHRVFANEEAVRLLSRALELLERQPPGRARDARELRLRTALGAPLVVVAGYGANAVAETYARAWELGERLGEPATGPVMRGVSLACLTRGELRRAHELGRRLLELGERDGDPMVVVEGRYVLGVSAFWLGELSAARDHLEAAIAGYLPERARSHLALYPQDPRVVCVSRLAYALWYLGQPEQAVRRAADAVRLAEELEHPFSLGYALTFASWLAIDSGDDAGALELAERLAGLADTRQLGFLQPMGAVLRGWAMAADGKAEEGIAVIRQGLDAYRRSGQPLYLPWSLRLLANVCIRHGRDESARAALVEALEVVEATEQRVLESDLHRLMGNLTLAVHRDREAAEARLVHAISIARGQGAGPLERRAAADLERLRAIAR